MQMTQDKLVMFETASFHIVKPCNMSCKFCYATFNDMTVKNQLSLTDSYNILDKLKDSGLKKITFAGGEPLLYRDLEKVIRYSKAIGLTTSIITNGSLLTHDFLFRMEGFLDWIGISIDSLNLYTNELIGRRSKMKLDYESLILKIKSHGYKLKINTVVNIHNENESMQSFIDWANPLRWKIFDTLKVIGQNDYQFEQIRTSPNGFYNFIKRHDHKSMVVESNELMTGSYLLIDPQGRLFEDSKGIHTYSKPLQYYNIDECLSEINLDREMFIARGGLYEW